MPDTVGDRVYQIRLALGDGKRSAMPMRAFARLLQEEGGKRVEPSTISLIERDLQRPSLDDIEAIASVDPEKRGRSWVAFGIDERKLVGDPDAARGVMDTVISERELEQPPNEYRVVADAGLRGANISTLEPKLRELAYKRSEALSLEELREETLMLAESFYTHLGSIFNELTPTGIDWQNDVDRTMRYLRATVARIRNRRSLVDFRLEMLDYNRLLMMAALSRDHQESADRLLEYTPRPRAEALVKVENDLPGQPLREPPRVVQSEMERRADEFDDTLAENGIVRPEWMLEYEREGAKGDLEVGKKYYTELLRIRIQHLLALWEDQAPKNAAIHLKELAASFELAVQKVRSHLELLQTSEAFISVIVDWQYVDVNPEKPLDITERLERVRDTLAAQSRALRAAEDAQAASETPSRARKRRPA